MYLLLWPTLAYLGNASLIWIGAMGKHESRSSEIVYGVRMVIDLKTWRELGTQGGNSGIKHGPSCTHPRQD